PSAAQAPPAVLVRALRSALRMSQAQLARRCAVPQPHIARLEAGKCGVQMDTLRRIFDAMFCDLLILPLARKRPSDALGRAGSRLPL
ncbi:MAG: helix-turn-helix domain-containing protein, partial [Elusimicrobia bacterium]|nr:helix-turn-helix domain-containing protein [Elusimicrobiota bacterium]